MLITKKMLLALTLVAALVGGTIGALVTHSTAKADNDTATTTTTTPSTDATQAAYRNDNPNANQVDVNAALFKTSEEQAAYRQGYNDCSQGQLYYAFRQPSRLLRLQLNASRPDLLAKTPR